MNTNLDLFFVILARDSEHVHDKIEEIESYDIPYQVICGEEMDDPRVIYREPKGKWDVVNYSRKVIPDETDVVVFNDVDTRIFGLENALSWIEEGYDLVYAKVRVPEGPQVKFYRLMDPIRKRLHMFASGELMLIRREVFEEILPIPPCLAEDSYTLFKAMELGHDVMFCEDAWVETERTSCPEEEEEYKARTTLGILQALDHSNPPSWIRLIYSILPALAPFLSVFGEEGEAWKRGIQRAIRKHRRGVEISRF